ncbi:hypothetical protein QYF36_024593 [Acer negundo]|nr:hypothetical protein QYF36_024593 [Acer negundo]
MVNTCGNQGNDPFKKVGSVKGKYAWIRKVKERLGPLLVRSYKGLGVQLRDFKVNRSAGVCVDDESSSSSEMEILDGLGNRILGDPAQGVVKPTLEVKSLYAKSDVGHTMIRPDGFGLLGGDDGLYLDDGWDSDDIRTLERGAEAQIQKGLEVNLGGVAVDTVRTLDFGVSNSSPNTETNLEMVNVTVAAE